MTSQFTIGEKVTLNGKEYTITGTVARSFILERDGKKYKATADKMNKIEAQCEARANAPATPAQPPRSEIDRRVEYAAMWYKHSNSTMNLLTRPTTESECAVWFDRLRCELSPENLFCDGEISRTQAMKKRAAIIRCWKELELIVGHRVQE
jgi:hypothetical protein